MKITHLTITRYPMTDEEINAEFGDRGWSLVCVVDEGMLTRYYFKREELK